MTSRTQLICTRPSRARASPVLRSVAAMLSARAAHGSSAAVVRARVHRRKMSAARAAPSAPRAAAAGITELTITRPDDWRAPVQLATLAPRVNASSLRFRRHLHLRDGPSLTSVVPFTARVFGRAVVMPNLKPPVRTLADATAYRQRVLAAVPAGAAFEPLMTLYLTGASRALIRDAHVPGR